MRKLPNLIFIGGKGGVGRSTLAASLAQALGPGTQSISLCGATGLSAHDAFREYIFLKLGRNLLTEMFVKNRIVQFLADAAPGISDLVLLGKVWHDAPLVKHLVVELPSMGFGIALFQSVRNFQKLVGAGPIKKDTEAMLASLGDPSRTVFLIAAIPEETPLRECGEMIERLEQMFPENPPEVILNRLLPEGPSDLSKLSGVDFVQAIRTRQKQNLELLSDRNPVRFRLREYAEQGDALIERLSQSIADQLGAQNGP